jgi:hypothetical protein
LTPDPANPGGFVLGGPGGPPPGAVPPPVPGGFAPVTTIVVRTASGAVPVTVVAPIRGGAPQVLVPGLLQAVPIPVPSATPFGTPGLSAAFPIGRPF